MILLEPDCANLHMNLYKKMHIFELINTNRLDDGENMVLDSEKRLERIHLLELLREKGLYD